MAKGSSLNRTKMMKEGTLEHQEEENNGKGEIWADKIHLSFSFELFKYVWQLKQKLSNSLWYGSKCV